MSDSGFVSRLKKTGLLLPPLADYTDYPYRMILAEFDPPFLCTEMVSPEALLRNNPKTMDMLRLVEGKHLNGVQLVGARKDSMGKAASMVEEIGFDYIDINMGCTVSTVTRTGAGLALMRDEDLAVDIVSEIIKKTSVPVTCKMRLGVSENNKNALSLSRKLVDIGVSEITVHGRTGEKKFGLEVDYEGIGEIVKQLEIPIVANGGIFNSEDGLNVFKLTGAEAVMPGRGLIGNPWIIPEILSIKEKIQYTDPTLDERKEVFLRHLEYTCDFFGERNGISLTRRVIGKYFSGAIRLSMLKLRSHKVNSVEKIRQLLDGLSEVNGRVQFDLRGHR